MSGKDELAELEKQLTHVNGTLDQLRKDHDELVVAYDAIVNATEVQSLGQQRINIQAASAKMNTSVKNSWHNQERKLRLIADIGMLKMNMMFGEQNKNMVKLTRWMAVFAGAMLILSVSNFFKPVNVSLDQIPVQVQHDPVVVVIQHNFPEPGEEPVTE